MIEKRIVRDEADTIDLVETYSTDGFKLRQVETSIIYGSSVIDVIKEWAGDEPVAPYGYEETDEKEIEEYEID